VGGARSSSDAGERGALRDGDHTCWYVVSTRVAESEHAEKKSGIIHHNHTSYMDIMDIMHGYHTCVVSYMDRSLHQEPQPIQQTHKLTRLLVLRAHRARAALGGADSTRAERLVHLVHQARVTEGVPVVERAAGTGAGSRLSGGRLHGGRLAGGRLSRGRLARSRRTRSRGAGTRTRAGAGASCELPLLALLVGNAFPQTNGGTVGVVSPEQVDAVLQFVRASDELHCTVALYLPLLVWRLIAGPRGNTSFGQ
jgi:hypothetical protein